MLRRIHGAAAVAALRVVHRDIRALDECVDIAAMELAHLGIRVNGLAPGIINTRLSAFVINDPVQSKVFLDRTPMRRFAESVEMARPILWMCSDDSGFLTGELMVVDGGYSVGLPVPGVLDEPLVPGGVR